jgi:hypothetical protein
VPSYLGSRATRRSRCNPPLAKVYLPLGHFTIFDDSGQSPRSICCCPRSHFVFVDIRYAGRHESKLHSAPKTRGRREDKTTARRLGCKNPVLVAVQSRTSESAFCRSGEYWDFSDVARADLHRVWQRFSGNHQASRRFNGSICRPFSRVVRIYWA